MGLGDDHGKAGLLGFGGKIETKKRGLPGLFFFKKNVFI